MRKREANTKRKMQNYTLLSAEQRDRHGGQTETRRTDRDTENRQRLRHREQTETQRTDTHREPTET